ncbi:uncharacterized protein LOC135491000 [Lineus longissimus]|uniref:uncharacterized protein LOC135491000 n=1 Tax=Lineus longissimus TaxID=88925 RepID=UPI002B4F1949
MAAFCKILLLLVACAVTMVASRGHHRHGHGFHHLKKHLHRLHLKHLKEQLLTTLMPSTSQPLLATKENKVAEEYKITPSVSNVEFEPTARPKQLLAEAELDQKPETDIFESNPEVSDLKSKVEKETDAETSIWGKPLSKQPKEEKWISYDELKKDFKYDDKSTLPIYDKPIYEENDISAPGPQTKGFSPVAMPKRFVSYDKNRDGFISIKELQKVTGAVEHSDQAFKDTDKNGDGYISPEEFMGAPWILEDDPDQNAQLQETRSFLKTRMQALDGEPSMEDDDGDADAEDWYPLNDD